MIHGAGEFEDSRSRPGDNLGLLQPWEKGASEWTARNRLGEPGLKSARSLILLGEVVEVGKGDLLWLDESHRVEEISSIELEDPSGPFGDGGDFFG